MLVHFLDTVQLVANQQHMGYCIAAVPFTYKFVCGTEAVSSNDSSDTLSAGKGCYGNIALPSDEDWYQCWAPLDYIGLCSQRRFSLMWDGQASYGKLVPGEHIPMVLWWLEVMLCSHGNQLETGVPLYWCRDEPGCCLYTLVKCIIGAVTGVKSARKYPTHMWVKAKTPWSKTWIQWNLSNWKIQIGNSILAM